MATSRFENLRTALVTAITNRLATDSVTGVTVQKYPRVIGEREDTVSLGNISGSQEPFTQGASGFREEEMTIEVRVRCPRFGDTTDEFGEAEQRAETVMASIENAVRTDITVSSTVYNIEFSQYETDHTTDGDGAVGVVDITLVATAHI